MSTIITVSIRSYWLALLFVCVSRVLLREDGPSTIGKFNVLQLTGSTYLATGAPVDATELEDGRLVDGKPRNLALRKPRGCPLLRLQLAAVLWRLLLFGVLEAVSMAVNDHR